MKIDWWFWTIFLAGIAAIFLSIVCSGCTTGRSIFGGTTSSGGIETIIPSSPAAQMWKVVAKSNWVVTICLLGFGAGLFTFFNGKPQLGLAIVFSSLGTLFFGLAVHRFPTWMAVVGLLGAVAGVVASILMKHRAIIEIIKGGQLFKGKLESDAAVTKSEASLIKQQFTNKQKQEQSPTTQKLVKKIKSNLKLKGEL
jgi:hypothetical protein